MEFYNSSQVKFSLTFILQNGGVSVDRIITEIKEAIHIAIKYILPPLIIYFLLK